jgi:solute:Na+ symporter, SSS family
VLLGFVILYIIFTLAIGVYVSRFVKNARDFAVASKKMPIFITTAAFFATWFGSETIIGASSEILEHGVLGIIEEPFGAALCLLLVGWLFAKTLYNMNLLTMGDFFRKRYGPKIELLASGFMVFSYFGWIAAQLVAFAIVLQVISGCSIEVGVWVAAIITLIYTYTGGMWAVSITDFVQSIAIVIGLIALFINLVVDIGGVNNLTNVINSYPEGFFNFFPEPSTQNYIDYSAAWMVVGLGSIVQQDIFQRIMAADSAKTAARGSIVGGVLYLTIGLLPLINVLIAKYLYPEIAAMDGQMVLVNAVLYHTSDFIKILFFGALLSAVMSTASGAILAPATTLAENIIKPRLTNISEKDFLAIMRISVVIIAVISVLIANVNKDIYHLVGEASAVNLVSIFVPFVAGMWFRRSSGLGAALAIIVGTIAWVIVKIFGCNIAGLEIPDMMVGFFASIVSMIIGSIIQKANYQNPEITKDLNYA